MHSGVTFLSYSPPPPHSSQLDPFVPGPLPAGSVRPRSLFEESFTIHQQQTSAHASFHCGGGLLPGTGHSLYPLTSTTTTAITATHGFYDYSSPTKKRKQNEVAPLLHHHHQPQNFSLAPSLSPCPPHTKRKRDCDTEEEHNDQPPKEKGEDVASIKHHKVEHKAPNHKDIPKARLVLVRVSCDAKETVEAKILYKEPWGMMVSLLETNAHLDVRCGQRFWTKFTGTVHSVTNIPIVELVHQC